MRHRLSIALASGIASFACSAPPHGASAPSQAAVPAAPWSAPALEHAISIRDGKTGARLALDGLLDELARADVVFLGETHTDETTHRVELAVYDGVLTRRDGRTVLAMEMFERDVQPALDAYVQGTLDEPAFLSRARPWSNYRTAYRPLIERAKAAHAPVVASNFPAPLRRRVASERGGDFASLKPEERELAPATLLANTPAYWRRVDNAIRGHLGMMGPKPAADDPRLNSTQSLWDNTMGESCALALDRHPDHSVVHVNGGFHSEYWDGTARQFALRRPNAQARTVAIVPVANPSVAELGAVPVADYVVFVEERAKDVNDGAYSVLVARPLAYRLHVPPQASDAARVPLLIWLSDDGENAEDSLAAWKQRLGDTCAIAVVDAPYRERQDDLVEGGRWFWNDSFREDVSALRDGIERTYGFVLRHQPVDPARVVLAGEGTGATIVSASALLSDELAVRALALAPRRYADIKDFPLPLPEERGDAPRVAKSLHLYVEAGDEAWWSGELAEYTSIGFDNTLTTLGTDPWRRELERENAVRTALGLPAREVASNAPRAHVIVDGAHARAWSRGLAFEHAQRGELVALLGEAPSGADSKAIELGIHASDFARGARLPSAPGAFGGTTVIVLPDDMSADEAQGWFDLQKADPLAKSSPFLSMVVATATGEHALPLVLADLEKRHKKNVLIAPASWCANDGTMRALQRSVRAFEDRMNLSWRPGLGGLTGATGE